MKSIIGYIRMYVRASDLRILVSAVVFTSIAIFLNYREGLNNFLYGLPEMDQYAGWYLIFLSAIIFPYLLMVVLHRKDYFRHKGFVLLLLIAPAFFSWKMVAHPWFSISTSVVENRYWNQVIYWPLKLVIMCLLLYIMGKLFGEKRLLYGLTTEGFDARPYLMMLLIMVPLLAFASTQKDFLAMYPRMQQMDFLKAPGRGLYKVLYELSYGSDFITIELFFRGFLVLAFCKWAGKDAILPMACFYCTIHFGKPMGECISSFFGGLLLGIVIYHTRTILGGLIVHLGIAWLMELGGYLGHLWMS